MREDLIPLVKQLPKENFCLLKKIILFLHEITKHEETNKMNAKNLSTVFGPNLLHFPDADDMEMIIRDTPKLTAVTSVLISHATHIFEDTGKIEVFCFYFFILVIFLLKKVYF